MISNLPTIGARFDIAKIDSGSYGVECWKVFWRSVAPVAIRGSLLFEGDTSATLAGQENVYCIAVQNADVEAINRVRTALGGSPEFHGLSSQPAFIEAALCTGEPLAEAGKVDHFGALIGDAFNSRPALSAVTKDGSIAKLTTEPARAAVPPPKYDQPEISGKPDEGPSLGSPLPWKHGRKSWTAIGVVAEEFLTVKLAQPVRVYAYELARERRTLWATVGIVLLAGLLFPVWFSILLVLMIPGWFYMVYRVAEEWRDASRLELGAGIKVLSIFGLVGFAGIMGLGGAVTMLAVWRKWGSLVVVRTDKHLILLKLAPKVLVPRFSKMELFPASITSLDVLSETRVALKSAGMERQLTLFRRALVSGLSPQASDENHRRLIHGAGIRED